MNKIEWQPMKAVQDDGIIAMSPTVPASEHTLAYRIVIRDLGDQYVVHQQVFERNPRDGHYFTTGNYFQRRREVESSDTPDWEALRAAYAKFDELSRNILNVPRAK
jgi:hypothetical protein